MRAVSFVRAWGALTLAHSNLERVQVGDGMLIIAIVAATICEADRRFVSGSKQIDGHSKCTTLGHEAVGRIVAIGKGVSTKWKHGDWVVIMPHQVPDSERSKVAFQRGEIFKLHTQHAGMHCDGTMATHCEWPVEWVRKLPIGTIRRARQASNLHGLHWTLPLAEIEHLACVMTSLDQFVHAEKTWAQSRNLQRLQSGKGQILLVGAGWMGWLYYLHLTALFPNALIAIKDPDEARVKMFLELASSVLGKTPDVAYGSERSATEAFDVGIMATAARAAALDMFRFLKPGGHVVFFSGIHNGASDLVFDPAKLSDLERVHRDGISVPVFRTSIADEHDMVTASGTSGYTVRAFERATRKIGDYAMGIAAGITGVVLGMDSSELVSVRSGAMALANQEGTPILKTLFEPVWPGRQSHLKVGIHPNPSAEIIATYARYHASNKGVRS